MVWIVFGLFDRNPDIDSVWDSLEGAQKRVNEVRDSYVSVWIKGYEVKSIEEGEFPPPQPEVEDTLVGDILDEIFNFNEDDPVHY